MKRLLVHAGGFQFGAERHAEVLVGIGKPSAVAGGLRVHAFCMPRLATFFYAWSVLRTGFRFNVAKQEPAGNLMTGGDVT